MKKLIILFLYAILITTTACSFTGEAPKEGVGEKTVQSEELLPTEEMIQTVETVQTEEEQVDLQTEQDTQTIETEAENPIICEEGDTLESRFNAPDGYDRTAEDEGSLALFLRNYPMKPYGSKVLLYDKREKGNQGAHASVFVLPIEEYDLQQCADSVMRVYAEYFWATGQYDRIAFHFTNGFEARYDKWREGYRIDVNGNNVSWVSSASYDDSYECFVAYLKMVFCYAGTLSMETEATETTMEELKVGDVFLYGSSPGHVVMVVDTCVNLKGEKAFLLAQGYMPAQEFHVLKNPNHEEDPWYYESELTYPLFTPEYTFDEGSLKSLNY